MKGIVGKCTAALLALMPMLATAQGPVPSAPSPRPGQTINLPPHVREQLWPTRELTPVEAELKRHVDTINDTLQRVTATVTMFERQRLSRTSDAVLRSTTRTLASDCARVSRTAVPVDSFANTLSTDNAKWGESALRSYRTAISELRRAMTACATDAERVVAATEPVPGERVATISERALTAVRGYQVAENGLLRTLRMDTTPTPKAPR